MPADAAVPEPVLVAFDIIEQHLKTLHEVNPDEVREMKALVARAEALLISFSTKHHFRYPIGD
jgi:hypothetical protein